KHSARPAGCPALVSHLSRSTAFSPDSTQLLWELRSAAAVLNASGHTCPPGHERPAASRRAPLLPLLGYASRLPRFVPAHRQSTSRRRPRLAGRRRKVRASPPPTPRRRPLPSSPAPEPRGSRTRALAPAPPRRAPDGRPPPAEIAPAAGPHPPQPLPPARAHP